MVTVGLITIKTAILHISVRTDFKTAAPLAVSVTSIIHLFVHHLFTHKLRKANVLWSSLGFFRSILHCIFLVIVEIVEVSC